MNPRKTTSTAAAVAGLASLLLLSSLSLQAQDVATELPVDCEPSLDRLIAWPRMVMGKNREEAIAALGLGAPRRVSVELSESRHQQSDGFIPILRFELSWTDIRIAYLQSSTGGRELLQELSLGPSESPLDFEIPFGTLRGEILSQLGTPEEASERTLVYNCPNMIGEDKLTFSFRNDRLAEVHWWFSID